MSRNDADEVRSAAELLLNSRHHMAAHHRSIGGLHPPPFDISRAHSINLITEEFLGGYMQDGRMSVVRRFFCLFVTFDLIFVALLWLICIMINGDNIMHAFQKQIVHYTIYTSLFDVVAAAIFRFVFLIFFYAIFYINHWIIIALSTSGSCLFLIAKVFVFDWVDSSQQVFEVILIITSFVLAWGEAWFLDCRVIPQERHARHYFSALTSSDRSPLMVAPFLSAQNEHQQPGSVANFYSPLDSAHNSDEEDEQDEEYHRMGLDCLRKAYDLLESSDWKVEKVTPKRDTISSTQRDKIGKIFKLTAHIKYPAKALMEELFYKVEEVPKWNPTLLESKIVRKINSYTDITYQASVGGGGGMIKSRDFVNLRCWRLFRNGKICEDVDAKLTSDDDDDDENILSRSCEGSVSTISDSDSWTPQPSSVGSGRAKFPSHQNVNSSNASYQTLSKSLGAKGFASGLAPPIDFDEPPPLDDEFEDAKDNLEETIKPAPKKRGGAEVQDLGKTKNKVWLSAALSVEGCIAPTSRYTRGQNIVTGFALHEIVGKPNACIFEWILCLDLKGYIPRYVLDSAYTTFMTDYMTHLRKYVNELRQKRRMVS